MQNGEDTRYFQLALFSKCKWKTKTKTKAKNETESTKNEETKNFARNKNTKLILKEQQTINVCVARNEKAA